MVQSSLSQSSGGSSSSVHAQPSGIIFNFFDVENNFALRIIVKHLQSLFSFISGFVRRRVGNVLVCADIFLTEYVLGAHSAKAFNLFASNSCRVRTPPR